MINNPLKWDVESCWFLDIRELFELEFFNSKIGILKEITLPPINDQLARSRNIYAKSSVDWQGQFQIDVTYPSESPWFPGPNDFDYAISTYPVKCNRGGERLYLVCPIEKENGRICGKRVQTLFLPPGKEMLGCRECHNLVYVSSRKNNIQPPMVIGSSPRVNWLYDLKEEFDLYKKKYNIGTNDNIPVQVASGSTEQKVWRSPTEELLELMIPFANIPKSEANRLRRNLQDTYSEESGSANNT